MFFLRVGWDNEMDLALVPLPLSWYSLINVGWWQLERERESWWWICDLYGIVYLYISLSISLFIFYLCNFSYYYYSLLGLTVMIAIKTRYMNFVVSFLFFLKLWVSCIWYCGKVCRYICWEINKLLISFSLFQKLEGTNNGWNVQLH